MWLNVDFSAALISEWDGLFYFECKFTHPLQCTTMYEVQDGFGVILMGTMCAGLRYFGKTSCGDTWLRQWHPLLPTILLHSNPFSATQYLLSEYRGQDRVISDRSWLLN